jgi:hypothetical protein
MLTFSFFQEFRERNAFGLDTTKLRQVKLRSAVRASFLGLDAGVTNDWAFRGDVNEIAALLCRTSSRM